MKFSAWQTSSRLPKGSAAHFWRERKILYMHSMSLCGLLVANHTLKVAPEETRRCSICEELERAK